MSESPPPVAPVPAVAGPVLERLRCAPFHRDQHVDPIGNAAGYDGYLVVDVAPPWDREVTDQEPLRSIVGGQSSAAVSADGSRWRPLARVPDPGLVARGLRRVTAHRATVADLDGLELTGPFERREWVLPAERVVALGRAVLGLEPLDGDDPIGDDEISGALVAPEVAGSDLLICTHGRRDQCCGSLGTTVHELLGQLWAGSAAPARRQRISHTGGHRFAPTSITLPDGYLWSHLDAEAADRLVRRVDPPEAFALNCRGCSLFPSPARQIADRAGLIEVGWEWADAPRGFQLAAFDRATMATTVRVTAVLTGAAVRSFDVTAVPDRQVPTPTCGVIDAPEYSTDTVWRVDRVEPV